ncbi:MAG: TetR family transcriptional regulator [Sporolactobacillus sp.]|jgi:AcrR family transcriptional regulator|nr:TetR family transcriptional regulator [Sporolactobacillus sp.]
MTTLINPNDPRAKRTRKFLQQAFTELLKQKDFDKITIQDIADQAEMNRSTFYSHFQDKYELLDVTLNTMFSDILSERIPADSNLDEPSLVRNLMLAICQYQIETGKCINLKSTLSLYIEENIKNQLYSIIFSCVANKMHTHVLQEKRRIELIVTIISSAIYGIVLDWTHKGQLDDPEQLVRDALPLILTILHVNDLDAE